MIFFMENCVGTNSVLRTGKMMTLHPSQGCVWNQIGSIRKHAQTKAVARTGAFRRFRVEPLFTRGNMVPRMSAEAVSIETRLRRSKGREARTQSIATRFTPTEERVLLEAATGQGRNLREWAREILLAAAQQQKQEGGPALFTEVQALRRSVTTKGLFCSGILTLSQKTQMRTAG